MSKKQFRDFKSAREFVRKLDLKNVKEWNEYLKSGNKPDYIPNWPDGIYKNKGWVGYGDWLGTGRVANQNFEYRDFESAREFTRKLKLKGQKEWKEYCKSGNKPDDIPNWPNQTYKNKGWVSWGDWLGTGRISDHKKIFRDFNLSKKFVKKLNLKNTTQQNAYCKSGNKPDDIPTNPQKIYKNNGWVDFADFLGSGLISNYAKSKQYLSFSEAREEARRLAKKYNIKTTSDWQNAVKKGWIPKNIPSNPSYIYPKKNIKKNVQRNN